MKCVAVNELPFHGSEFFRFGKPEEKPEDFKNYGLFRKIFFNLKKYEKLQAVIRTIPASASYISPEIQNEVLSILASVVTEQIATLYQRSNVGGVENLSVVCFVKDGLAGEYLLGLYELKHLTAEYISDPILQVLKECGFSDQLLVQCYDRSTVMSERTGVQRKIQDKVGQTIPYIYCYNHQLHLVVVNVFSKISAVNNFFRSCNYIYNFITKFNVNQLYCETQLRRLLQYRWTGHLATAAV